MAHMQESSIRLDALDRRVIAALQVNGRASWKQVASAIDAPESTVTRRGTRLLATRSVFVTGVLDHLRTGLGISVYMRFRARPGRALSVAQALAAHSAPRFVTVMLGAFDVAAEVVVKTPTDVLTVLSDLENIDDVVESESTVVLRKFAAFEEWNPQTLSPEGVTLLQGASAAPSYPHREWVEPETLTSQELQIARVLARDGRASYAAVAAAVGISESTAARRVESLTTRGCLRFRTLFAPRLIGLGIEFMLWLDVAPDRVDEVGEKLATLPSTQYVSAATGRHNLILQGVLPSHGDLYPYQTQVIGALDGVRSADMTLQIQTLKRAWVPIGTDGRPEPQED